ncbi:MAG: biotin/lipoate A/B protein ligase family protein [Acidobacteriota bacterium]
MKWLDLTCSTPDQNLACDEVYLELCEAGMDEEILRFWEPDRYFVVLGSSNRVATEVNLEFCQRSNIPVLRRPSGGGTVLQGPGVLNFSLLLRIDSSGPTRTISGTNCAVMTRHREALQPLLHHAVKIQGHIDLTLEGLKFSGNAQRRKQRFLLFHGTFLLGLDFAMVEQCLHLPSKRPDYRRDRPHRDFLTNLNLPAGRVKETLRRAWKAEEKLEEIPADKIERLAAEVYSKREWTFRF